MPPVVISIDPKITYLSADEGRALISIVTRFSTPIDRGTVGRLSEVVLRGERNQRIEIVHVYRNIRGISIGVTRGEL